MSHRHDHAADAQRRMRTLHRLRFAAGGAQFIGDDTLAISPGPPASRITGSGAARAKNSRANDTLPLTRDYITDWDFARIADSLRPEVCSRWLARGQ